MSSLDQTIESESLQAERETGFRFIRIEEGFSVLLLALMSLLPVVEVVGRRLLGRGVPGSIPIVQHLTLWVAFFGAALAARSDRLLALSTADALPERWRARVRVFTSGAAAAVCLSLFAASLDLLEVEREMGEVVALGVPVWVALLAMPVGLLVILFRLLWQSANHARGRLVATSLLAIPALLSIFPSLQGEALLAPGLILLLAATALGMPIFAALGGAALLFFWTSGIPIASVPVEAYRLTAQPMLPAVPLFTLAGFLLSEGGASRRVMRTFTALFGWMPGGLAIVTTLVLAFFTPLTGASGVTILSMGGLLLPVLVDARYPEKTSVGLVTVSGSIGLLFVPSLPVILYGVYSHTPIDELFLGGLLPGILLVALVAVWGALRGHAGGAGRTPFRLGEAIDALWEAKWELALPFFVLFGIFGGLTTLVEAAALTVLYALVVECFVYRDSRLRDLVPIAVESATLVGGFLIILGAALGFTNYLIQAEVPTRALHWVQTYIDSPLVFLLTLNVFLIVIGALMDIYSAIFVIVPLIAPMAAAYGIHPVHMGIVFLANMELGYLMPPMGENLFLSSYRFKQSLTRVYRSTGPYVVLLLLAVLLITYVPALTLWPLELLGK